MTMTTADLKTALIVAAEMLAKGVNPNTVAKDLRRLAKELKQNKEKK